MVWKCNLDKNAHVSKTSKTKLPCLDKKYFILFREGFINVSLKIVFNDGLVSLLSTIFLLLLLSSHLYVCVSCLHVIYHTWPCCIMTGETPILSLAIPRILFISYHVMVKYFSRFLSFLTSWMFSSGNVISSSSSLVPLLINLALIIIY